MNEDETYEGYANRETWAASLWLNNQQEMYTAARIAAAECRMIGEREARRVEDEYAIEATPERIRQAGAAALKEAIDLREYADRYLVDPRDGTPNSMMDDIGSVWRIDWQELYDVLTED